MVPRSTLRWTLVVAGTASFGCNSPAPLTRQAVSADLAQRRPPARAPYLPAPAGVSLFGDHPDSEGVPYENRLLTNMTQHTFATIGRDFDPDLHRDGQTIVFASTRNAERADLYYKNVDGLAITQLTSDPADDIQPRFSPDGKRVVFCSNRAGNWDIWMVRLDGTGLTQLTSGRTDEIGPCWSTDGQRVAFTGWGRRSRQWEIWTLSIDQPGVRRFLAYGMFPDWSPNGKYIAFQRARQRGTRWFSVWTIELVGQEARYPTEIAYSDNAACTAPRWSPDGAMLTFSAVRNTGVSGVMRRPQHAVADVWIVDVATGVRHKITDGAAASFNPLWSPDGRIFFVSAQNGVENVWSLTSDARIPAGVAAGGTPSDAALSRTREATD